EAGFRRVAISPLLIDHAARLAEVEQKLLERKTARPTVVGAERLREVVARQVVVLSGDTREEALIEERGVTDSVARRSQVFTQAVSLRKKICASFANASLCNAHLRLRFHSARMQLQRDFRGLLQSKLGVWRDRNIGCAGQSANACGDAESQHR